MCCFSELHAVTIQSPSITMPLPSVLVLKTYVPSKRHMRKMPAFTRRNLYLRDKFCCQYCHTTYPPAYLTYDHVVPRAANGGTSWENVVTACSQCNGRKGSKLLKDLPSDMRRGPIKPRAPTWNELQQNARKFPPKAMHSDWADYLGGTAQGALEMRKSFKPRLPELSDEDWGI